MFFKTLVQRKFIGNENLYWDRITRITVLRSMILQHNEKRYKLDLMFGKVPAKCDNYFPGCRCCLILSINGMKSNLFLSALLYLFLNKLVTSVQHFLKMGSVKLVISFHACNIVSVFNSTMITSKIMLLKCTSPHSSVCSMIEVLFPFSFGPNYMLKLRF